MRKNMALAVLYLGIIVMPLLPIQRIDAASMDSSIVISEVQTGGLTNELIEDGRMEFIELHNQLPEELSVDGLRIQYFTYSKLDVYDPLAEPTRELTILAGSVAENGYILLSYIDFLPDADVYFGEGSTVPSGMLARTGGHIRLLSDEGVILDVIGWGTAKSPETKAVREVEPGNSVARKALDDSLLLVDTDNNYNDFEQIDSPTPTGGSLLEPVSEEDTEVETIIPVCDDAIITEIMPNPEGVDTGKEFIELYNPETYRVYLEDCLLKTSANSKTYLFPIGSFIEPDEYLAIYGTESGLSLLNVAGGEVILLGTNTEYAVQYPADMRAGHSWSFLENSWLGTSLPTPGAQNLYPEIVTVIDDDEVMPAPCPEGKYRNPETNRCKNIQPVASTLSPCAIGQIRNPETNRCRNITNLVSSLVPCRAGQERNPETNRCRSVLAATSEPKPCEEGYERNPETNRCRKKAVIPVLTSAGSTPEQPQKSDMNIVLLVSGIVGVLGYGMYEYRRDMFNLAKTAKVVLSNKFTKQ